MKITAAKIKRELEKNYGWENLFINDKNENTSILIEYLIKDILSVVNEILKQQKRNINKIKIMSDNRKFCISKLEDEIVRARYSILAATNYYDENIIMYIPDLMQQYIVSQYPLNFLPAKNITQWLGMKVVDGYENAIIVAHKESAVRNIPVVKIKFH